MRYTPKQYALALYEALKDSHNKDETIKSFAQILVKNHDRSLAPKIFRHFSRIERVKDEKHVVELTTAKEATESLLKEIKHRVGGKTVIQEKVDPAVLGGIKVIIDDEQVIDGTFAGRMRRLFQNKQK